MGHVKPLGVGKEGFETEFRAKIDCPSPVFGVGVPIAVHRHNSMADSGPCPGFRHRDIKTRSLFLVTHFLLLYFRNIHFIRAEMEFLEIFLALAAPGAGENRSR